MGVGDPRLVSFAIGAGERPAAVRISSVGIDATTETLEIVDGEMQDPTTADRVAWYKESAKLGLDGNTVLAGHLNYWGVPEGVFVRLADVQVGDEIVIEGDRGGVYTYRVVWTEPIDADTNELSEIVGPSDGRTLTLITCGGRWDASEAEYDQRTVVRAELVATT
jgi:LPXTG-site transpeptidase (sortase) family protein